MKYNKQEIIMAMLKTANLLDAEPNKYRYMHGMSEDIDHTCEACALVWIGHFLPYPGRFTSDVIANAIMPGDSKPMEKEEEFYQAMEKYAATTYAFSSLNAHDVAFCLREYVKEYLA